MILKIRKIKSVYGQLEWHWLGILKTIERILAWMCTIWLQSHITSLIRCLPLIDSQNLSCAGSVLRIKAEFDRYDLHDLI